MCVFVGMVGIYSAAVKWGNTFSHALNLQNHMQGDWKWGKQCECVYVHVNLFVWLYMQVQVCVLHQMHKWY